MAVARQNKRRGGAAGGGAHAMFFSRSLGLGGRISFSVFASGSGLVAIRPASAAPAAPAATATPTSEAPANRQGRLSARS